MTNLTKLSNAELNKRLAELLGPSGYKTHYKKNGTSQFSYGVSFREPLDFCSSWADIGPVIEELRIDLGWTVVGIDSRIEWSALCMHRDAPITLGEASDKSPTRAATICAIMVLEQEGA